MTWPHNLLNQKVDIPDAAFEVADEHLAFYRDLVVAEARAGYLDKRTRNDFIIAVGTRSLMNVDDRPNQVAGEAFYKVAGMLAVEAVDDEMPYWTKDEWKTTIKKRFDAFKPRPHEKSPEDDSYLGYLVVTEMLRARGRYPMQISGVTYGATLRERHYAFSGRARHARLLAR